MFFSSLQLMQVKEIALQITELYLEPFYFLAQHVLFSNRWA
jgi:hypothetical protein